MVAPSIVGVFGFDGAACIDDSSNVTLNVLFVIIGIAAVGEAYYAACAVEVFDGACGAGFGKNLCALEGELKLIIPYIQDSSI